MSHSPWGKIQHVDKICLGMSFVHTASHGGIRISRKLLSEKSVSEAWLLEKCATSYSANYAFFEEDCAAWVMLFDCPELCREYARIRGIDENEVFEHGKAQAKMFYPDYFTEAG